MYIGIKYNLNKIPFQYIKVRRKIKVIKKATVCAVAF